MMIKSIFQHSPENTQLVACTVRFARELIQMLQDSLEIPNALGK